MFKINHEPRGCPIVDDTQPAKQRRLRAQCPAKSYSNRPAATVAKEARQQRRAALLREALLSVARSAGGEGRKRVRAMARGRMHNIYRGTFQG